jgi:hypothetical protein
MKKTKIIITFTENNIPKAKIKNATSSQLIDASMLLRNAKLPTAKKRKNNFIQFVSRLNRFRKRLAKTMKAELTKAQNSRKTKYNSFVVNQPKLPQKI